MTEHSESPELPQNSHPEMYEDPILTPEELQDLTADFEATSLILFGDHLSPLTARAELTTEDATGNSVTMVAETRGDKFAYSLLITEETDEEVSSAAKQVTQPDSLILQGGSILRTRQYDLDTAGVFSFTIVYCIRLANGAVISLPDDTDLQSWAQHAPYGLKIKSKQLAKSYAKDAALRQSHHNDIVFALDILTKYALEYESGRE